MKKMLKNKKGFTLVELVVVIAILAILALILVPSITGYVSKAETSRDQANARTLYTAALLAKETMTAGETLTQAALDIAGFTEGSVSEANGVITVTFGDVTFNGSEFGTATSSN